MTAPRSFSKALSTISTGVFLLFSASAAADIGRIPGPGLPGFGGCASIDTHNATKKWIWITIYDLGKLTQLDWGWVAPLSKREWRSGNYSCAGIYYVRAEVKSHEGPQPADTGNIFDTTVQVKGMGNNHVVYLVSDISAVRYTTGGGGVVAGGAPQYYCVGNNKTFWWTVGSRPDCGPSTATATYDQPVLKLANAMVSPMLVKWRPVLDASIPQGHQNYQAEMQRPGDCVQPNAEWRSVRYTAGAYNLMIAHVDRCDATSTATYNDAAVSVAWGENRRAYRANLKQTGASLGNAQLSFTNRTTQSIQFVLDGLPETQSPCAAPAGKVFVSRLPEGPRKVTPVARARCGDAATLASFAPANVTVGKFANAFLEFGYEVINR